jgi:hypothetical protein
MHIEIGSISRHRNRFSSGSEPQSPFDQQRTPAIEPEVLEI